MKQTCWLPFDLLVGMRQPCWLQEDGFGYWHETDLLVAIRQIYWLPWKRLLSATRQICWMPWDTFVGDRETCHETDLKVATTDVIVAMQQVCWSQWDRSANCHVMNCWLPGNRSVGCQREIEEIWFPWHWSAVSFCPDPLLIKFGNDRSKEFLWVYTIKRETF